MQERFLGQTGLRVSPLGLGLAALGRPAYLNLGHAGDLAGKTDAAGLERNLHAVLDAAHAAGVRYLDAARSYGNAERFLASWLERRGLRPAGAACPVSVAACRRGFHFDPTVTSPGRQVPGRLDGVEATEFERALDRLRLPRPAHREPDRQARVTQALELIEHRLVLEHPALEPDRVDLVETEVIAE